MYRADPRSERALKNVAEMLDTERPDLVIHTGDVIFGKPAEASLREILSLIADRKIPFAVTLGNHDEEFGKNRREVFDIIRSIPYNINTPVKEIYGVSNDIITLSSATDDTVKWVFYLFDSTATPNCPESKDTTTSISIRSPGTGTTARLSQNATEAHLFLHWHFSISRCPNTTMPPGWTRAA